jgi:hypothetical protein
MHLAIEVYGLLEKLEKSIWGFEEAGFLYK